MEKSRYQEISDQGLLERYFQTKDKQWLGVLLERHTLLLYGVCMKYLRDAEEARDMVQQVQLKVMEEIGKYKVEFFRSWLYTVTVNLCNMQLRNRQHLIREITDWDLGSWPSEAKMPDPQKEKQLEMLRPAMDELKEAQRECVRKFYLENKTYRDITRETGMSIKQVKSNIQNGKRNLRLILERDFSKQK